MTPEYPQNDPLSTPKVNLGYPQSDLSEPSKFKVTSIKHAGAGDISEKSPSHRINSCKVITEEFFHKDRETDRRSEIKVSDQGLTQKYILRQEQK